MRVLVLPHRYPPHGRGGVETWSRALARALLGAGHAAAILTRDDRDRPQGSADRATRPPFSRFEERESTPSGDLPVHWIVHRHGDARGYRGTWDDARFDAPIATLLEAFRPDVVHLAHPDGWGRRPIEVARRAGIPVVATLHDYKWICGRGQMIRPPGRICARIEESRCARCLSGQLDRGPLRAIASDLLSRVPSPRASALRAALDSDSMDVDQRRLPGPRAVARWRDRRRELVRALESVAEVTAPSRFVADRHREAGLSRAVTVVRQGLPEVAPPPRAPSSRLRLGWFGTDTPTKGLGFLLRAVAALPPGSLALHVHGVDAASVAAAAQRAGCRVPPGVVAHGPYPPDEAVRRMSTVDLVAIPSQWDENAPMVATEARWAGCALLVSSRGGLPEGVRHDVDGWVEASDDVAAWAERLALCAAHPAWVTAAARRAPAPRTAARMAAEYLDVYERAAAGRLAPSA